MTISSSLSDREQYSGNDVTTAFTVNFEFDDESELDVYLDGTLQTISTHYTVSGGSGSSGTVTMVTAPATGETLTIVRDMGFDQAVDSNDTAETTYDKLTSQIRQLEEEVNRSVKLHPATTITDASIAYGEMTADYYFKINSAGDGIEAVDLTSTFQSTDSDLTALAALSSNGVAARTGSGTWSVRTITAGDGVSVADGDGVSGNPTISADINGLSADGSPDLSNDFVMTYDADAGGLKKVALTNLTGGSASPTFITTEDETTDYPNSLQLTKGSGVNIEDTSNTVTVSWDPNSLAAVTSLQSTDLFGVYDVSATGNKKVTLANLGDGVSANLTFTGLSAATPANADKLYLWDDDAGSLKYITWADVPAVAASTLSGLSDTTISSPSNGEFLKYNGSAWINASVASTDLSDTADITYNADTDVSANGWVLDEDTMTSDSATKVPTQQSVKAYVDAQAGGDSWGDAVDADIVPDADGTRDLGSAVNRFAEAHVDTLEIAGNSITALPTGDVVGTSDAQTLTNKTINTASNTITVVEADISDLGSYITASSTNTLINKTFDANGTGNSLSNVETADIASGSKSGSDTTIVTGTAGTSGNLGEWNADGDLVDSSLATSNVMDLNNDQEYTGTKNFNATTLTDGATINWDASANQVCKVTLGGNRTMAAPTNLVDGGTYVLRVIQDATGTRTITWNAVFKWPGGTAPTLSTGNGDIDIITFVSDGTNMYGTFALDFS